MKFSSFKKEQLLMESWRGFLKEGDPDKLDDIRAEIEKRAELKKGLEDKLGGMTRDEIGKHVDDLTAGIDFGDVSDEQYVESVIWAILHPEEAKGDAPKSALSGPRPGEKSEF